MKVTIEIENDQEFQALKDFLKENKVTVIELKQNKKYALEQIANQYNIDLPQDFKFNREEANERG